MDFIEKARIRLENWISHNDHHKEEYEMFADQLKTARKNERARFVRKMTALLAKSNECLIKALRVLE
ncbi:MAG: hypothetical protein SRB2_04162 [Desulfobacteraceae bacterium Eth-SRB2]|nr:MAG: hypothetical protein SRB2_04162 [Desulfobacteraceae bacterium Eth-SRB2]